MWFSWLAGISEQTQHRSFSRTQSYVHPASREAVPICTPLPFQPHAQYKNTILQNTKPHTILCQASDELYNNYIKTSWTYSSSFQYSSDVWQDSTVLDRKSMRWFLSSLALSKRKTVSLMLRNLSEVTQQPGDAFVSRYSWLWSSCLPL